MPSTSILIDPNVVWVMLNVMAMFFTALGLISPLSASGRILKPGMIVYFVKTIFSPLFATLLWGFDAYYTAVTGTATDVGGNTIGFTIWPLGIFFVAVMVVMAIFTFTMMVVEGLAVLRDEDIFEPQATDQASGPYE